MRQLRSVFVPSHRSIVPENIARLAVLYEDLRIELRGASTSSIRKLDEMDPRYRRNYFVRKCIGTTVEFAEAIRLLDQSPDFKAIKSRFPGWARRQWTEAVKFFSRHERLLKDVRNDIGGHFGIKAAKYAIANSHADAVGKLQVIDIGGPRARFYLNFVGEIVAVASLRHLTGTTSAQRFSGLLRILVVSFRHSTRCVNAIIATYLWERFGR
jgi:hypothetical protein